MVLAGLDPKTGKKPVSADVSGNNAVDAAIVGGEAVSGNNAADAAADSQSTSGTTAVSGNDAAQDAEDAQAADGAQATADAQAAKGAQAAEDAAAKTFALSKEEIAQLDPTTGVQATVRPWLQDFTATWVKGHISYGPEEIRAQIQAVYDAGYEEWILWNAANRYTEGGLLTQEEEEQ